MNTVIMIKEAIKILLVEDHVIIQRAMTMMLTGLGYCVDQARSAAEALDYFQNHSYHVIFMDIGLPDRNGLSVAESIRNSKDKEKALTPIVIISAHSDESYRPQAESLGIEDIIVKPVTMEICDALIKKYSSVAA